MTETIPIRVQHKRMTTSDWADSSIILLDGELGVESDTGRIKVGNGHDLYSALLYLTGPAGPIGPQGPTGPAGTQGIKGETGSPGQNIINQNGGQPLKYWAGTKAQYDAIANKDENTIYDIYTA